METMKEEEKKDWEKNGTPTAGQELGIQQEEGRRENPRRSQDSKSPEGRPLAHVIPNTSPSETQYTALSSTIPITCSP